MKIKLLLLIVTMASTFAWSQSKVLWQKQTVNSSTVLKSNHQSLKEFHSFNLNTESLRQSLNGVAQRNNFTTQSTTILLFPNYEGKLERFSIKEASVMHPDLQARYPDIRSYVGQGIDNPSSVLRFSLSPNGLNAMILSSSGASTFIEPVSNGSNLHIVFNRKNRLSYNDDFECEVTENIRRSLSSGVVQKNADDGVLRTYRIAVSATGEYTQYHGGTKALALDAINTTMTRVNGIYESDFNVTLQLIANTDDVIYTSTSSDPYGNSTSGYNSQLQSTLTSQIGESNYDVGHLFANLQNNGNAGCIGCVCVNNQKGSGWTSHTTPEGDPFDVDYVAHELGHQFGANHTWTFGGNEGTNVQFEPGSGSTIMGYAGITGSTDVQQNSDPYFHAASIEQVTDYIKSTSCQTNVNTGNATPSVNAGSNYTIPRGTPFILEGSATDSDAGDVLSYCWEQMDENNASSTNPSTTATSGVAFRSFNPTTNPDRYFPRLQTVKTGATSWQWEAVPNVGRTLNFRLTVRDNVAGGGTNNSDDMVVTVNGSAGPFVLNSPNTNVTWNAGTTQSVTWNVAGTTGNGINAANVDIFLSVDGGDTYPISLASGVPNDGSHDIVVPNNQGNQNRIMVRGSNNIFFDISNTNFTIAGQVVCNADVPTGLVASNVATTTATLSWDAVPGATYDLRYREVGTSTWTTNTVTGVSTNLSGLTALTQYEAQVRSKCAGGSNSAYSGLVNFTTTDVQLDYCNSASTNVNDEYISRVQLNTIDNASGAQFYSDFTNISTTLTKDSQYTITVTPTWTGTVYNEAYSVWIDYNRDGDFSDAGEQVWTQGNTQATSVSGTFTIPSSAVENATRMRVSMKYNGIPSECETFTYGEVEDYTVIIEGNGPDTEAPIITLNGASIIDLIVGDTYTELGATATDNVDGDLTSSIVIGGDSVNTSVAGVYNVTYNVSDAAGNAATEVIRTVNVTADTTAPVITLIGASVINLEQGDAYTDQGATATDDIDGDLTSSIVVGGDSVDTNVVGSYVITYNVSDAAGNAAVEVTRTVNVNQDTTKPVITLIGSATINLNIGDNYVEQGATATDNFDGDITANIIISGTVNTSVAGTYFVNYDVSDAAGNAADTVTRTVVVAEDTTPPVINLIGSSTVNLFVGDAYTEQGATATDNIDGDISSSIVITGNVDTSIAGTYTVEYNVSDSAGNAAAEVVRTVIVSEQPTGCTDNEVTITITFDNYPEETSWSLVTDSGQTVASGGTYGNQPDGSTYTETLCLPDDCYTFTINDTYGDGICCSYGNGSYSVTGLSGTLASGGSFTNSQATNFCLGSQPEPTCDDGIQNGDETGIDCGGTFCEPCSATDVVLHEGYFESGWDNWIDGGSDCARVSSSNSYEGNYSIRIRDNSGTASAMTLNNIDVSPFAQVEVDFYFYVLSMENGEDFWLRYFDGSSWNTVQTWTRGVNINNNTFYNATVTLTSAQYNLVGNSGFRFQNDASGNNDQIFIDQVTITGISGGSKGKADRLEIVGYGDSPELSEFDIRLYPNPVNGNILNVEIPSLETFNYKIVNILGKTVLSGTSEGKINVSKLEGGMYFIEVNDGDEIITKKFIKN
ncbi:immunoglobulin-like domain-containing protein [Winogradskyella pulchriflava]|uniref:Immunoglobulin-like domain-containing protein n=1 Tax=Winogradskyella pulchriflava TaxID=1110688 RepID=A0ABV6Q550_9FLAO